MLKVFRGYEKIQSIIKEKVPMTAKIWQVLHVILTLAGVIGVPTLDDKWLQNPAHASIFSGLVAFSVLLHFICPSIFGGPTKQAQDTADPTINSSAKLGIVLLSVMLLPVVMNAQTVGTSSSTVQLPAAPAATATTSQPQNFYAVGVSFNPGASPQVAGNILYGHALNSSGTYGFSDVDIIPNTIRPFTVTTNVGAGIAQKVASFGKYDVWVPTAAGVSINGSNTGWQWNGGAAVSVPIKQNWFLLPNVRFLKSSVSGGTGYQIIAGIDVGFSK
jgi:hypothetical protein